MKYIIGLVIVGVLCAYSASEKALEAGRVMIFTCGTNYGAATALTNIGEPDAAKPFVKVLTQPGCTTLLKEYKEFAGH